MLECLKATIHPRLQGYIQGWMEDCGATDSDWFIIDPCSIGDAYHTLGLLPEFRRRHAREGQRIVVMMNRRCLPLGKVMPYADACFAVDMGPLFPALNWAAEQDVFAPGFPLVAHPDYHGRGTLGRLSECRQMTFLDTKRYIMRVGFDEPLAPPVIPDDIRDKAHRHLEAQSVPRGESVILVPHSNSYRELPGEFWEAVVGELKGRFELFTDTTPGNPALDGTRPLEIKLEALLPAVNWAGAAIAVRSGLSDFMSTVEVPFVTVYPGNAFAKYWTAKHSHISLSNMGLRVPELEVRLSRQPDPATAGRVAAQRLLEAVRSE
jgi:hypothetical protein